MQGLNDNNKYTWKKNYLSCINNGFIFEITDDLSFLMGSHGRDNFIGLINYEDVFTLDQYCI